MITDLAFILFGCASIYLGSMQHGGTRASVLLVTGGFNIGFSLCRIIKERR